MLKALGWLIKTSLFIGLVLMLSHLIQWKNESISDRVKTTVSSVEKNVLNKLDTSHVKEKIEDWKKNTETFVKAKEEPAKLKRIKADSLSKNDRQKMRAFIRNLEELETQSK